jgi:hypothetical protein
MSTDIDGSVIVILSEDEARAVYRALRFIQSLGHRLNNMEERIIHKIHKHEEFDGLG